MEPVNQKAETKRNMERFILVLLTIYNIGMFMVSLQMKYEIWTSVLILLCTFLCYLIYFGKYGEFRIRAILTSLVMQGSLCVFSLQVDDWLKIIPIVIGEAVVVGFYGIPEICYIFVMATLIIFVYNGVWLEHISMKTPIDMHQVILQIANVLLVEFVIYFWVKKRNETSVELLEVIKGLKKAEESKDDFLANVSHEIRTPINTICGISEMVLREDDLEKAKDQVFYIQTAGRNLMSVVSDILDFSELQSGKVEIEEEAYSITSTINDIINMSMARKSEKNIELIVDCDADVPRLLLGDEKKICRIIMNLVNNAIKFTNEGGVIISVSYRKEAYGINLCVTIKDTGIGMTEESVERLFKSFNQVDARRNRQEGGIGLGLAISQVLAKKMGGVITIKSKYGEGTSVKFVVPQKVVEEEPIVELKDKDKLNVGIYIDMEQFKVVAIRDEYSNTIRHLAGQFNARSRICRNLAELKRRMEKEPFTHIFISIVEYNQDKRYFESLVEKVYVIIVLDHEDEKEVTDTRFLKIYKPFYVLSIVSVLNGGGIGNASKYVKHKSKFIAPKAQVLVVDDNMMNIQVISGLLNNYKIDVSVANSGREALEKVEQTRYDFIFMDHMMPEMDGVETLHRIRNKRGSYYQRVPIIALTANTIAGAREMFLKEGFNDFLEKPVEISVLERVLKRNIPEEKIEYINEEESEGRIGEKEPTDFKVGDLDVEKGFLYCGGKDDYIKVLKVYSASAEQIKEKLEICYQQQNWKDYTIQVHAIKSSMLGIGAVNLSEQAKKLEAAGKEERISYILENHDIMLQEYDRVMALLQNHPEIGRGKEEKEESWEYPELEEQVFAEKIQLLEDSMMDLDGAKMLEIIEQLQEYQYYQQPLDKPLQILRKKIEMSDYMSFIIFHFNFFVRSEL